MYPSLPLRMYGYGDFAAFNLGVFRNIPLEQVPYILASIANDLVSKANTNAARMYTYNKLCANNWYNNEFMSVARAILAVVSGRSQAGVDITHIANDVIEKYMTCYTSVQVLITPELKSTLPPNLVLASQHNASQLQQFNEEANKVFMNNNQMMPQQGMPMQQGMMMPGQQPMGMQPGMMGGQPMGMHPMQMQQPMVYNQQMMPMQAQMQPMGMPQPMGGQASFTQQGFGYQNPMAQQPEVSSKFKDVPAAYQAKEQPNVFTRAAEQVQATQVEVTSPVVSKPTVVHLTKDSPDNFMKVGDKVFSFDNVLQTKYSSDFRDKKFFKANVEMLGCLKEAVEATRHYQLENQQENYIYQAYSAPYYIIDECPTMFSCGDVVNEVLLGTVSFEEFARTLEGFYKVIDDVIEQANKENDARKLVEFYEKYKFAKGIEKTLVTKINHLLGKVYGLKTRIDNFHTDAVELTTYLQKKQGDDLASKYSRFVNNLVSSLRDSYREEFRELVNKYMTGFDDEVDNLNKFEYRVQNVYVVNVPISKDNYSGLAASEVHLNEHQCREVAQWLRSSAKHALETLDVYDLFMVTLDEEVFQVHFNYTSKTYTLTKLVSH